MRRVIRSLILFPVLACAVLTAAGERRVETVAPGLRHLVMSRGQVATESRYRISLGSFESQSAADAMLERLQKNGVGAFPLSFGDAYSIVTQSFSNRSDAEALRQRLIDRGFAEPLEIEEITQDLTHSEGPWRIHVLEADPSAVHVQIAHAYDAGIGLETTADLAIRRGALAAVNGGFYFMKGLLAGDSQGVLRIDGRLISEPDRGRAAVGFYDHKGTVRAVFGRLAFRGAVRIEDGDTIPIDGLNRAREPAEVILYTPDFHRTTLTPPGGAEVIIESSRIARVLDGVGSSVIPPDGMVLSIGSERVDEVLPGLKSGSRASVETEILPILPDSEGAWRKAEDVVGCGPLLLWKGRQLEEPEEESISSVFFLARHPRTAAGVRADGTLLFVTVDGRRLEESVGMSLPELTDLMLELGAVSAINLDGGGSTTMVINGTVVNHPSGESPRRNADAILIYPRKP